MPHNYKKLEFWNKSKELCITIYKLTNEFPKEEKYGITSQIRRCSVSIASNIAEGSSRASKKDFNRFLEISIGSAYELQTQLIIAQEIGYFTLNTGEMIQNELNTIIKMVHKFKKILKEN